MAREAQKTHVASGWQSTLTLGLATGIGLALGWGFTAALSPALNGIWIVIVRIAAVGSASAIVALVVAGLSKLARSRKRDLSSDAEPATGPTTHGCQVTGACAGTASGGRPTFRKGILVVKGVRIF
jgi:hypothetical protein